jgi:hypothetical protein
MHRHKGRSSSSGSLPMPLPTTRRQMLGMSVVGAIGVTAGAIVSTNVTASAQATSLTVLDPPQRAYDSRNSDGPLASGTLRAVGLGNAGVPQAAAAVLINLTIVNTVGAGYLSVLRADAAQYLSPRSCVAD